MIYNDLPNNGAQTPVAVGAKQWRRPFDDLTDELVFTQEYRQQTAEFKPARLDTQHETLPDFFLVEEGPREDIGGLLKWTRTYARIPPSRAVYESYSWTVPGIGSEAVYSDVNISANSSAAGVTTLTTSSSSTATVGDSVLIDYTFTDGVTGTQYGRKVLRTCLSGTSGTTVKVSVISEPGGTVTYNSLRKVQPGRDPKTEEVWSKLQMDYFLPGITTGVTAPEDIPVISALEIFDNTGRETTSFTATTSPTITAWRSTVAAGTWVAVVSSVPRRWMGNIYERATRYVRAK